ncbi:MAG: hypothetical protein WCX69_01200 [Candidatus Paceibacterota bacterium]
MSAFKKFQGVLRKIFKANGDPISQWLAWLLSALVAYPLGLLVSFLFPVLFFAIIGVALRIEYGRPKKIVKRFQLLSGAALVYAATLYGWWNWCDNEFFQRIISVIFGLTILYPAYEFLAALNSAENIKDAVSSFRETMREYVNDSLKTLALYYGPE